MVIKYFSAKNTVTDRQNSLHCMTIEAAECLKSWGQSSLINFESAAEISAILQNCEQEVLVSRVVN